jgi:hypothetical protein
LAVISLAQPALAQTITGGFNIDIIEGDVTYESGGAMVLTATDLGISSLIPADLAQEILNGESVDGFFVSPVNLSSYAAANLTQFPSVSDAYFVDQAMHRQESRALFWIIMAMSPPPPAI